MSKNTNGKQNKVLKPIDINKPDETAKIPEEQNADVTVNNEMEEISEVHESVSSNSKPTVPEPTYDNKSAYRSVNTVNEDDAVVHSNYKLGTKVVIKKDVKKSVTGSELPVYAHRLVYKVDKILPSRIIIRCESLTFAVNEYDLEPYVRGMIV